MKVNFSPRATCNNYNINYIDISEKLLPKEIGNFSNIFITGLISGEKQISSKKSIFEQKNNFFGHFCVKNSEKNEIFFNFDENNKNLVEQIEIEVEEKVHGKVLVKYESNVPSYHNGLVNFVVKDEAELDVTIYIDLADSLNILSVGLELGAGSCANINIVDMSNNTSCCLLNADAPKDNSKLNVKSIYMASGARVDYNYLANVAGENSNVDMDCVGVLNSKSTKSFKGTIRFAKGAKHCVGREMELCLPLSKGCVSLSSPMILCDEEDVDASHSTSLGKIDDKTMFYMNSRGIDKVEAQKMFVKAQMGKVLDSLDSRVRGKILDKIDGIDYEK